MLEILTTSFRFVVIMPFLIFNAVFCFVFLVIMKYLQNAVCIINKSVFDWSMIGWYNVFPIWNHSHKKRKDSLETRAVFLIFSLELEISGVAIQRIHQNSEKWWLLIGIGHFTKRCFCQFGDRKVVGLMPKYYLLARDTNQVSIFSLHKIKTSKQHRLTL